MNDRGPRVIACIVIILARNNYYFKRNYCYHMFVQNINKKIKYFDINLINTQLLVLNTPDRSLKILEEYWKC